jgi:hypothetical protein
MEAHSTATQQALRAAVLGGALLAMFNVFLYLHQLSLQHVSAGACMAWGGSQRAGAAVENRAKL